jgi:hypothetical protein
VDLAARGLAGDTADQDLLTALGAGLVDQPSGVIHPSSSHCSRYSSKAAATFSTRPSGYSDSHVLAADADAKKCPWAQHLEG